MTLLKYIIVVFCVVFKGFFNGGGGGGGGSGRVCWGFVLWGFFLLTLTTSSVDDLIMIHVM